MKKYTLMVLLALEFLDVLQMKEGFQIVFMMIVKSIMMEVELIIRIAQKIG